MRLHFFTVRNIDDYRKFYRIHPPAQKMYKESPNCPVENFDQKFFFDHAKGTYGFSEKMYESRSVGETKIPGLHLAFYLGLRLDIPEGNFRVKISDADSGQIFFDKNISGGRLLSADEFYIRWKVEVFLDGEQVLSHTLNLEGQPVVIMFNKTPIGDMLAYLPFIREFKKRHKCDLSIYLPERMSKLVANLYPDLPQIPKLDFKAYATYHMYMIMSTFPLSRIDIRTLPMERAGGAVLGIETLPPKPIFKPTLPPVTDEPYVCISVQASMVKKGWFWPGGWDIVVNYLKSLGYRVFCIDLNKEETQNGLTNKMPEGAEDFTGNRPLMERANMLYHAEFFIGLSSGLAWIADAVGCPVVMICGFSQDWFEFYTPYRVANRFVCNGCFNDLRVFFTKKEPLCPYHNGTPRELECQKKISPRQVLNAIERLILDHNLTPPSAN